MITKIYIYIYIKRSRQPRNKTFIKEPKYNVFVLIFSQLNTKRMK